MRDRALAHLAHAVVWVLDRIERATGVHDDDLEAIVRATAEPTPIGDAALAAVVDRATAIEIACEDFAAEVEALADIELRDLLGETND